jgi:FkbH-like protein
VAIVAPLSGIWQKNFETTPNAATQTAAEAWAHVMSLRNNFDGLILLQNIFTTENRPGGILESRSHWGRADFARAVNLELSRRCRETGEAFVLDADWLAGQCGAAWAGLHKQQFMGSRPLADELASQLAAEIAAFCAARKGFVRKCLAVDFDNTLWGGVVGEDGVAGVQLAGGFPGNLYTELQKEIRALKERGVMLAAISKNNETDAWDVFKQRPEMILQQTDFSARRINWQDKAANLRELALELKLGLDAFVMLDDNPVERDLISEVLPEVEVCPVGDPLEMLRWLTRCRHFDTLAFTREDALRAKSYAAAEARSELAAQTVNLEEYLHSLNTQIEVGCNSAEQVARVAQLTQKTNQFNLTTRRYTESEIQKKIHDPCWRVFWCSCRDRFADEGVIGAALVKIAGDEYSLDTFLMSCRVLGRSVERAFVGSICQYAQTAGAKTIRGEFIPSAKNAQAEKFYETCGFISDGTTADGRSWRLSLPAPENLVPKWILLRIAEPELAKP